MAAELKQAFGTEAKLVRGGGGVFDVKVDGKLAYSKFQTHRFPEVGEMTRLLRAK